MRRTVSAPLPMLVSVTVCVVVWPEGTVPKLSGELGTILPLILNEPEPAP